MNQATLFDAPVPPFDGAALTPDDGDRLGRQLGAVRTCMLDHQWRTLAEIEVATGYPQASVSARLRDLRKDKFGGYTVERRRRFAATFEYRIADEDSQ